MSDMENETEKAKQRYNSVTWESDVWHLEK